jgi:dTDP-4-amino-4,6-dideoxygalactose transaminase
VEHALDTLKIKNGASHSEIIVTADGDIKIVEIGGRMGGDCIGSDLVKISTGYDFVDMVIDVACGKEPQFRKVCEPATAEIFFVFKPEDLQRLAVVQEQHPEQIYRISEMMPFDGHKVVDSSTRYGYVILRKDIRNLLNIKQNKLFVSRAATGIYLILKANEFAGKQILVPANICYAAIYPIIYSGNIPVFCDVDKNTGNVTLDIISKFTNKVEAMILPHMYGNPISDIAKIKELCVENNILLIEDCASAMGAKVGDKICGSWGDYVLFSTGYSKTIDVGEGGIIFSDRSLDKEAAIYKELPEKTEQEEINDAFFSKLYRLIRNNPDQTLSKYIWTGLEDNLKKIYVNQLPGIDKKILEGLKKLDVIVSQRQSEVQLYDELILENSYVHKYKWAEGAVPWRYCLLVDEPYRRELIEYLLENNIPVSDWYPVVTPIFGIKNNFPLATEMGNQLINFPLMIGSDEIKSICNSINAFLRRKEIK